MLSADINIRLDSIWNGFPHTEITLSRQLCYTSRGKKISRVICKGHSPQDITPKPGKCPGIIAFTVNQLKKEKNHCGNLNIIGSIIIYYRTTFTRTLLMRISWAYICAYTWTYHGHIMGISWAYTWAYTWA